MGEKTEGETMSMKYSIMGKIVLVKQVFRRQYEANKRWWAPEDIQPRAGWVVGVRSLQKGRRVDCGGGSAWEPDAGPATRCLLVTYWPTMNPVKVPFDGCEDTCEKPYSPSTNWSNEARIALRNEMADWPRNKKGRWVKK